MATDEVREPAPRAEPEKKAWTEPELEVFPIRDAEALGAIGADGSTGPS
ncbi:MAG TPA: hypothetical protein VGF50_07010 [Caulobacteraceae bacterium]|jgi:hypothetical protein